MDEETAADIQLTHFASLTDAQRGQRVNELLEFAVAMISHQVRTETPGLEEREVRIRVAERLYMNDEAALKLLARARNNATAG